MTLCRDPERGHQARRAIVLARLTTGAHVAEAEAEAWIAAWERRAGAIRVLRDSPHYWSTGLRWIAGKRDELEVEAGRLRAVS